MNESHSRPATSVKLEALLPYLAIETLRVLWRDCYAAIETSVEMDEATGRQFAAARILLRDLFHSIGEPILYDREFPTVADAMRRADQDADREARINRLNATVVANAEDLATIGNRLHRLEVKVGELTGLVDLWRETIPEGEPFAVVRERYEDDDDAEILAANAGSTLGYAGIVRQTDEETDESAVERADPVLPRPAYYTPLLVARSGQIIGAVDIVRGHVGKVDHATTFGNYRSPFPAASVYYWTDESGALLACHEGRDVITVDRTVALELEPLFLPPGQKIPDVTGSERLIRVRFLDGVPVDFNDSGEWVRDIERATIWTTRDANGGANADRPDPVAPVFEAFLAAGVARVLATLLEDWTIEIVHADATYHWGDYFIAPKSIPGSRAAGAIEDRVAPFPEDPILSESGEFPSFISPEDWAKYLTASETFGRSKNAFALLDPESAVALARTLAPALRRGLRLRLRTATEAFAALRASVARREIPNDGPYVRELRDSDLFQLDQFDDVLVFASRVDAEGESDPSYSRPRRVADVRFEYRHQTTI